jgi:O-antigen/teichoic acid export membrane protein
MGKPSRSLASSAALVTLADVIQAAVTVVTVRVLVHDLGAARFGVLSLVGILATQLLLLQLGVGPALTRRMAEATGHGRVDDRIRLERTALALSVIASLVCGLGFFVLAPHAWSLFSLPTPLRAELRSCMPAASLLVAAQPLVVTLYAALAGRQRFGRLAAIKTVHSTARALLPVVAIVLGGGLQEAFVAQAAVDWSVIAAWVASIGLSGVGPAPTRAVAADLLQLGVPLTMAGVISGLLGDGEKLGLSMARPVDDLSHYTVPFAALSRLTLLAGGLATVLVPRLAAAAAESRREAARIANGASRALVLLGSMIGAPLIALMPELLALWLSPEFSLRASLAARVLVVGFVINSSAYVWTAVLRSCERPRVLVVLYALELPVYLGLVYALVRIHGVSGAALAWTVRVSVDAAAQYLLARRALANEVGGSALLVSCGTILSGFAALCVGSSASVWLRLAAGLLLAAGAAVALLSFEGGSEARALLRRFVQRWK